MKLVSRRIAFLALTAGVSLVLSGCLSPTLPLPPPGPPEVSATSTEGTYRLTGTVTANAHVTAWNFTTGFSFGQQTAADGRYDFLIQGSEGDSMSLTYLIGTDESQPQDFVLKP